MPAHPRNLLWNVQKCVEAFEYASAVYFEEAGAWEADRNQEVGSLGLRFPFAGVEIFGNVNKVKDSEDIFTYTIYIYVFQKKETLAALTDALNYVDGKMMVLEDLDTWLDVNLKKRLWDGIGESGEYETVVGVDKIESLYAGDDLFGNAKEELSRYYTASRFTVIITTNAQKASALFS